MERGGHCASNVVEQVSVSMGKRRGIVRNVRGPKYVNMEHKGIIVSCAVDSGGANTARGSITARSVVGRGFVNIRESRDSASHVEAEESVFTASANKHARNANLS
jgi:hypothetical protein